MEIIKSITTFIKNFIKRHYLKIFFVAYLSYSIIYFMKYNSNDFGYTLIFTFLFIAVTAITEMVTIDLIWISRENRRDFTKQIKNFEDKHKECKKENIKFLETEKIELYKILFKERSFSIGKTMKLLGLCFVHIGLLTIICVKLFIANSQVDWSLFANVYPYTVFLLYFIQVDSDEKLNNMYTEMEHRGERKH